VEIEIVNRQRTVRVNAAGLSRFLRRAGHELPPRHADGFTVCLVSDRRMREYNRAFRSADRPTDVLSFPGDEEPDPEGRIHLGDVVIAVPTAARQARDAGHSLARELKILALHGYLHLLGHDHETDRGQMRRLQRRLERKLLPGKGGGPRR
jgi:probable rRNA maturation factor